MGAAFKYYLSKSTEILKANWLSKVNIVHQRNVSCD